MFFKVSAALFTTFVVFLAIASNSCFVVLAVCIMKKSVKRSIKIQKINLNL